jgi:hypothetical protein
MTNLTGNRGLYPKAYRLRCLSLLDIVEHYTSLVLKSCKYYGTLSLRNRRY